MIGGGGGCRGAAMEKKCLSLSPGGTWPNVKTAEKESKIQFILLYSTIDEAFYSPYSFKQILVAGSIIY